MGQKFLIDTNVLIDVQAGRIPDAGLRFMAEVMDNDFKHIEGLQLLNPWDM